MYKTHTIAAKCDQSEGFVLLIEVVDRMGRPLDETIAAMRDAAREWAKTRDGLRFTRSTSGVIDWGDFVNEVPARACEEHGFSIKSTFLSDLVVDHDANLLAD